MTAPLFKLRTGLAVVSLAAGWLLGWAALAPRSHAQTRENEVSTSLNKTINLTAGDLVEISNRYGPVEITATSGPELKVSMTATAWGGSKSRAEEVLERIGLIYEREGNKIVFKTEIESRKGIVWNTGSSGFRISVIVTMPELNELKVANRYGNTYFMDKLYRGRVTVEQSYGNLKGGTLAGSRCSVTVRYGKIDLGELSDGYLKVAYGSGRVSKLGHVFLDTGYSRVDIENGEDVKVDSDYDNLSFERVGRLEGTANYSGFQIERLDQSIQLSTKYMSGFRIERVSETFDRIDLRGSYSSFTLEFVPEATFEFEARLKRGNLRYPSEGVEVTRYERDENDSVYYTGHRGKNSKGRVYVEGSYTNVRMGIIGASGELRSGAGSHR